MTPTNTRRLHQCATHILLAHDLARLVRRDLPEASALEPELSLTQKLCRQAEAALSRALHDEQITPTDQDNTHPQPPKGETP